MLKIIIGLIRLIVSTLFCSKKDLFIYIATLQKENEILLRKLNSKNLKVQFNNNDRIFLSAIACISKKIRSLFTLVKPKTVLKWYRKLIKKYWTFPSWKNKGGRPRTPDDIRNIILEMKNNNLLWGTGKIRGELLKLGIELDRRTIARILIDFRKKGKVKKSLTWRKFIKSHFDSLFSMDFFTIDTFFNKRFYIFFIIRLATREIIHFDITINPTKRFVEQRLNDLMWNRKDKKIYLIHDRSGEFCYIDYKSRNITNITTSYKSPNMNAFAERFVRSVRQEALNWFIIFSEKQLKKILKDYINYYNKQRHHQGINNIPAGYESQNKGKVFSKPVLSGLYHHYYRKAG